jgi:S-sulfo-L-cysteine synthase (O-acetyl-L-serine-dependent)
LVTRESLLVGPSSGSVLSSMLKAAEKLDNGLLVGIFADDGRKFRSLYLEQNILRKEEYDNALISAKNISNVTYIH